MSDERNNLFTVRLVECQIELYAFIGALMPDSPNDVKDVVQETNLAVVRHAAEYNPDRPFRPWLWAFARNQVKAYRTRRGRSPLIFDDELTLVAAETYSAEYPERGGDGNTSLLSGLEHCRKRLSPKHRQLLDFRYTDRRPLPEIAKAIHSNPNSTAATLAYIRKKLGECIRSFCRLQESDSPAADVAAPEEKFLGSLIDQGWQPSETERFRDDLRSPELLKYWLDQNRVSSILSWEAQSQAGSRRLVAAGIGQPAFSFRRLAAIAAGLLVCTGLVAFGARALLNAGAQAKAAPAVEPVPVAVATVAAPETLVTQNQESVQSVVGKETEMNTKQMILTTVITSAVALASAQAQTWTNLVGTSTYFTPSGAKSLTLSGAAFPAGTLAIADGTTVTAEAPDAANACALPAALSNGLAFWVDANRNITTTNSGASVAQWADVRETASNIANQTWKYIRAITYVSPTGSIYSAVPPTFTNHFDACPGKQFVNFGEYFSGRWLLWVNPAGTVTQQTVRSYFGIVAFGSTCGHLLSAVSNPEALSGTAFFHKESGSQGGGAISAPTSDSILYNGETRLNGTRIDPRTTSYLWNRVQLFSQNGPYSATNGTPYASDFMNDRNYKAAAGYQNRQGGAQIGEMLVYDRVLSPEEREQVEAYLRNKWLGQPTLGAVSLATNATLAIQAEVPTALTDFTGAGDLVKSGTGTVTVARNSGAFTGALRLENGSWETVQNAEVPPLVPVAKTRLVADARLFYADTNRTDASLFEIEGSGYDSSRVRLAQPSTEVKKISVLDSTLVLQPRAAGTNAFAEPIPAFYSTTNLITNGSFETPVATAGWFTQYNLNTTNAGWYNTSEYAGVATYPSPWFGKDSSGNVASGLAIPDGSQCLYVQAKEAGLGSVQQTITVPAQGLYALSFYMSRRTSRGADVTFARFSVDGTNFYRNAVAATYRKTTSYADTAFQPYEVELPPLTAGAHTLTLAVDNNSTTDRAVLLDKLELLPKAEGDYVYVPNPGFESTTVMKYFSDNGYFTWAPSNASWGFVAAVFTNLVGNGDGSVTTNTYDGGAGITQASTWWTKYYEDPATDLADFRKAFIQRTAYITNTVTFPRAGRVRFSMRYANRWFGGWSGAILYVGSRFTGHTCHVFLDGTEIGSVAPVSSRMRTYQTDFDVAAGTYCLKIQNTVPNDALDRSTILDDIRFRYLGADTAPVADGTFVDGIGNSDSAWSAVSGTTVLPSVTVTDDGTAASLNEDAGIEATLTIPSNGVYYAAITAGGRALDPTSSRGVYNNFYYYPHLLNVTLAGTNVGSLVTDTPTPQRYVMRLPYLAAGSYTLRLQGIAASSVDYAASLVYQVAVNPLAVGRVADCYDFSKGTLSISSTSRLALDYLGSLKVETLRWNNVTVSGTINAKTYPALIVGPGEIVSPAKGTIFTLRGN